MTIVTVVVYIRHRVCKYNLGRMPRCSFSLFFFTSHLKYALLNDGYENLYSQCLHANALYWNVKYRSFLVRRGYRIFWQWALKGVVTEDRSPKTLFYFCSSIMFIIWIYLKLASAFFWIKYIENFIFFFTYRLFFGLYI